MTFIPSFTLSASAADETTMFVKFYTVPEDDPTYTAYQGQPIVLCYTTEDGTASGTVDKYHLLPLSQEYSYTGGTFGSNIIYNAFQSGSSIEANLDLGQDAGYVYHLIVEDSVSELIRDKVDLTIQENGAVTGTTGTYPGLVFADGCEISGGTFSGEVYVYSNVYATYAEIGTISGGTFSGKVYNYAGISGGTFNGEVRNATRSTDMRDSEIVGGTFNSTVTNTDNNETYTARITGGTFANPIVNNGGVVEVDVSTDIAITYRVTGHANIQGLEPNVVTDETEGTDLPTLDELKAVVSLPSNMDEDTFAWYRQDELFDADWNRLDGAEPLTVVPSNQTTNLNLWGDWDCYLELADCQITAVDGTALDTPVTGVQSYTEGDVLTIQAPLSRTVEGQPQVFTGWADRNGNALTGGTEEDGNAVLSYTMRKTWYEGEKSHALVAA
ncbi:MAG: hypothetical protein IJ465_07405, partial [Clostridia bacterium]|nr:hypothetical protein [Clostridia bacterium]